MDYPYDLGSHGMPVTTASPEAQVWFDRGLNWTYGFNHDEAMACFGRALECDPGCAMAHWGIAYAAGPNYNMPWSLYDDLSRAKALARAFDASRQALAHMAGVGKVERALIEALQVRYPQRDPADRMDAWDHAFADAMRAAFAAFPDALDLRSVFVESLMTLTPWKMWDLGAGTPAPGAATLEARRALEDAFASQPDAMRHPGLLHLYIHLMEMSPTPESALKAADVLRTLVPDAGHLVHMPTHIDVLCGNYHDVVHWNRRAIEADLKYYERNGAFNLYTGYRQHDYHFVVYGALFLGQMAPALEAVRGLAETTPEALLRIESPPMADYFESYLALEPHVLIRFGRWRQIIEMGYPEDRALHCTLVAYIDYAKAVAHAALGAVPEAKAAAALFIQSRARVPDTRLMHNNRVVDLLDIAEAMMWGEIAYREGRHDAAFDHLRHAISLEDTLPYDEPWGWMQPVRHALGALLFEQGRVAEAEAVYREDLGLGGQLSRATIHPDNVWSLKGLHDCLEARGETVEIALLRQKLDLARARADHAVGASCFCAQAAMRSASPHGGDQRR